MICQHCGREISDESTFCKFCGKRTDDKIICPSCGKELDDDSAFCMYCGTNIAKIPSKTNLATVVANKTSLLQSIAMALGLIIALISVIFVFFIGYRLSSGDSDIKANIFYYFGDAYKEYKDVIENAANDTANGEISFLFRVGTLFPYLLGSIVSLIALAGVCISAIISIVFAIKRLASGKGNSGEKHSVIACFFYIFGVVGLISLNALSLSDIEVKLDAATIAGVTLSAITLFMLVGLKLFTNYKTVFTKQNVPKVAVSLAMAVLSVVALSILTLPVISVKGLYSSKLDVNALYLATMIILQCVSKDMADIVGNGGAVLTLSIFSYLLLIVTIILIGLTLTHSIKRLFTQKTNNSSAKCAFTAAAFAIVHLIFIIIFTKQIEVAGGNANLGFEIVSFGFGVPIAALVLIVVAAVLSVIKFETFIKKPATNSDADN